MSAYGKVISGGKQMTKGVDKSINDKLSGFAKENERRKTVAGAVARAFNGQVLDNNYIQNVNGGSFQTAKKLKNV